MSSYYGIQGAEFHAAPNNVEDSKVTYKGFTFSEHEISDAMWEEYIHDEDGNLIPERDGDFAGFDTYMKENIDNVIELLENVKDSMQREAMSEKIKEYDKGEELTRENLDAKAAKIQEFLNIPYGTDLSVSLSAGKDDKYITLDYENVYNNIRESIDIRCNYKMNGHGENSIGSFMQALNYGISELQPDDVPDLNEEQFEELKEALDDIASDGMKNFWEYDAERFDELVEELGIEAREVTDEDRAAANTDFKCDATHIVVLGNQEYYNDKSAESLLEIMSFLERHPDHEVLHEQDIEQDKPKSMDDSLRDWYKTTFPDDDLGPALNKDARFSDILDALKQGKDVYDVMHVGDSVIRERIFKEISERAGMDYEDIYQMWIDKPTPEITLVPEPERDVTKLLTDTLKAIDTDIITYRAAGQLRAAKYLENAIGFAGVIKEGSEFKFEDPKGNYVTLDEYKYAENCLDSLASARGKAREFGHEENIERHEKEKKQIKEQEKQAPQHSVFEFDR